MDKELDMMDMTIYHYTTIKGLLGILSSGKFLFSDFSKSDDLRERYLLGSKNEKKKLKYICFCHGEEADNNPAMWSKYANNTRGVCIGIKLSTFLELNKNRGEFEHFPIEYVTSNFIRTGQDAVDEKKYKRDSWSFQKEYRFVSRTKRSMRINKECIDSISFFVKENDEAIRETCELCKKAGLVKFEIQVRGEKVSSRIPLCSKKISWKDLKNEAGRLRVRLMDMEDKQSSTQTHYGKASKVGVEVVEIHRSKSIEKRDDRTINLYDIEAAANLNSLLANKEQYIMGELRIPNIPKCDGAVYVRGDSMSPLLKSGDIVAYKQIPLEIQQIIFGEMYLVSIDMEGDEYLAVKYVNQSEKGDEWIKLVSYNPHHHPKDFPLSAVRAMALIKLSIRMNTMK